MIDYDDPDYAVGRALSEGRADRHARLRGLRRRPAIPASTGRCRTTNGMRSRSTTRPARPAIPKGVVYHHRGAALMAYANTIHAGMGKHAVYLWTLPMFHCNGWCFPWTLAVQAGTHVCLRWVRAKAMYDAIADHGVTHLCGAPIVMSTLINARRSRQARVSADRDLQHRRRAAAGSRALRHGRCRLRRDPSLRADRDLRAGGRQRMAWRMG